MATPCWAALDIGSNTVMTLVAQGDLDQLTEAAEWRATTRLGQGVDACGVLAPEAEERTLAALASQVAECRARYPSGCGVAVATSAARDARNGRDFLSRCRAVVGGMPRLLSGEEEARFTFRGVASDLPPAAALVHLDVGGGSSELTSGSAPGTCRSAESVNLGCVRIGERFGLLDRAAPGDADRARAAVRAVLAPACRRLTGATAANSALTVLSGGSATTYAAMRLALPAYDARRVHGWLGRTDELDESLRQLLTMSTEERSRLPCVGAGRAPVLPAGLLILYEFLRLRDAAAFRVSTKGLRFGLVLSLAAGELEATWSW